MSRANFRSPRFGSTRSVGLPNTATGKSIGYYQCGSCEDEDTSTRKNLFLQDNYDFLSVLSANDGVVHHVTGAGKYRDVRSDQRLVGRHCAKVTLRAGTGAGKFSRDL